MASACASSVGAALNAAAAGLPTAAVTAASSPPKPAAVAASTAFTEPPEDNKSKWRPIEAINTLGFKGGYLAKPISVDTKHFDVRGVSTRFVEVARKKEWLTKMAGGSLKRPGKVFDDMRAKYQEGTDGPAVAGTTGDAAPDPDDPMNQCDTLDNVVTPEPKKRRGAASKKAQ